MPTIAPSTMAAEPAPALRKLTWLTRAAFWFFLAKGLVWLALPVVAWLGWQTG